MAEDCDTGGQPGGQAGVVKARLRWGQPEREGRPYGQAVCKVVEGVSQDYLDSKLLKSHYFSLNNLI